MPTLVAFVTGVMPVFLTATLAPQIRTDIDLTASRLGFVTGAYFAAGSLASIAMGRVGERLGSVRAMRIGAGLSCISMFALGVLASSWLAVVACLAAAGVANALIDPAATLHLVRTVPESRLGFAIGLKQAAVPAATLVGGLAVALIAVPLGWRWVFILGASVALLAVVAAPKGESMTGATTVSNDEPAHGPLVVMSIGIGLAAASAASLATFVVDSATASGLSASSVGIIAALGGAAGVATRIGTGVWADVRSGPPMLMLRRLLQLGVVALLALASGVPWVLVLAVPLAFMTAWGWPTLLSVVIVRRHPGAPSAATGIVNRGAFLGAVAGPVLFGVVVDRYGYATAWMLAATLTGVAASVLAVGSTFGELDTAAGDGPRWGP